LRRQQFKIVGKGRCYFGKIIRWMAGCCIAVSKPKNKVSFSDQFWFIFDGDKLYPCCGTSCFLLFFKDALLV